MLLSLATGDKIGLAVVGGIFIVFALVSAMLIPRYRPGFPGRRGLRAFILASLLLFVTMMAAVQVFGAEEEEAAEEEAGKPAEDGGTGAGGSEQGRTIRVAGVDFAFRFPETTLAPGAYTFELENEGKVEHNLVVEGPNVEDATTKTIGPGKTSSVRVELAQGTYTAYCSVPGHREAGMETELKVG